MARKLQLFQISEIVREKLVLLVMPPKESIAKHVLAAGARDVLLLSKNGPSQAERLTGGYAEKQYRRIPCVRKNNCNVAILHGSSTFALLEKREFARFTHILVPTGVSLIAMALGLILYGKRGILKLAGVTQIRSGYVSSTFFVLETKVSSHDVARQYAPAGLSPMEIIREIEDIKYVLLRGAEEIANGDHLGDIDLLVAQSDLAELKARFQKKVGTYPVDIYSEDGQNGHAYKGVPYFTIPLARKLLKYAEINSSGIRLPTGEWAYTALCYHLLFHGKIRTPSDQNEKLRPKSFTREKYYHELVKSVKAAGLPLPASIHDLEKHLKAGGFMPSLDMIGFYSNKNSFLKDRYFGNPSVRMGLVTFFVRDFGQCAELNDMLRLRLSENFEILSEGAVDQFNRDTVIRGVRGGNWIDEAAPGNIAEPVYWFVCWDPNPVAPSAKTRRKHPRVDNENIRLKDQLRRDLGRNGAIRSLRVIHSSDNSMEAIDHIHLLGLEAHPQIAARLTMLNLPNYSPV